MFCASTYPPFTNGQPDIVLDLTNITVSGNVAREPVFSPKSGRIFERSTVVSYIQKFHKDPVTNDELAEEDLLPVAAATAPAILPTTTSIPSLLSAMQTEWDSVALEIFSLKKQVQKAREELSVALYHHDAAVRVASKALQERDEYKKALQELSASVGKGESLDIAMDEGSARSNAAPSVTRVPPSVAEQISSAGDTLLALHRSQKSKSTAAAVTGLHTLRDSVHKVSMKKATASALSSTNRLLVGSSTGTSVVVDLSNPDHNDEKIAYTKMGPVTAAAWVSTTPVPGETAALTPIIALGSKLMLGGNAKTATDINRGGLNIVALAVHPLLSHLFVAFTETGVWALHDTTAQLFQSAPTDHVLTSGAIHPDGALIASGFANGDIIVYELASGNVAGTFHVSDAAVTSVMFGVNGYSLFVGTEASQVHVIDLRKGTTSAVIDTACGSIRGMTTDPACSLLVTSGERSTVFHRYIKKGKEWVANAGVLEGTKVAVTDLYWETGAPHIVCVGLSGQIVECEFQA